MRVEMFIKFKTYISMPQDISFYSELILSAFLWALVSILSSGLWLYILWKWEWICLYNSNPTFLCFKTSVFIKNWSYNHGFGLYFLTGVQVYGCIFCENESGYAYMIQNPHFLASRHQFLFSIDLIIMAFGSISLWGVQV